MFALASLPSLATSSMAASSLVAASSLSDREAPKRKSTPATLNTCWDQFTILLLIVVGIIIALLCRGRSELFTFCVIIIWAIVTIILREIFRYVFQKDGICCWAHSHHNKEGIR